MYERYLIRLENEAIGLRYELPTGKMMIGGNYRLREDVEMFIEEYFGGTVPEPTFIQNRKMRYTLTVRKKAYDKGIKRLRDNGLLEKVKSLGRIIR